MAMFDEAVKKVAELRERRSVLKQQIADREYDLRQCEMDLAQETARAAKLIQTQAPELAEHIAKEAASR